MLERAGARYEAQNGGQQDEGNLRGEGVVVDGKKIYPAKLGTGPADEHQMLRDALYRGAKFSGDTKPGAVL